MKYTKETSDRILAAIDERLPEGRVGPCPICGTTDWKLASGFVVLKVEARVRGMAFGGPAIPCAAIVCKNCGNTHLMNLVVLGLEDLFQPEPESEKQPSSEMK